MADLNFGRSYTIEFGTPEVVKEAYNIQGVFATPAEGVVDATTVPSNARRISNLVSDGNSTRGFNFTFSSKRMASGAAATKSEKSILEILNLTPEMLSVFNQDGCMVIIRAGYEERVNLVYTGVVESVNRRNLGSDISYRIKLGEISTSAKKAKVSLSYPESYPIAKVVRDLISKVPSATAGTLAMADLESKYMTGGVCVQGNLLSGVERVLKRYGYDFSIFNGKISARPEKLTQGGIDYNLLAPNTYVMDEDVVVNLDPIIDNKVKNNKDVKRSVVLTTFLLPITPEQFFTIPPHISSEMAGTYKITSIQTKISSRGMDFYSIVTGAPM